MMRGELRAVRPEASGDARDSIDHGDGLDLDVRTLFQLDDADAGGRRRILVPDLATNAVENRPLVLSIGEVHRHLDHVLEATAAVRTDSHLAKILRIWPPTSPLGALPVTGPHPMKPPMSIRCPQRT